MMSVFRTSGPELPTPSPPGLPPPPRPTVSPLDILPAARPPLLGLIPCERRHHDFLSRRSTPPPPWHLSLRRCHSAHYCGMYCHGWSRQHYLEWRYRKTRSTRRCCLPGSAATAPRPGCRTVHCCGRCCCGPCPRQSRNTRCHCRYFPCRKSNKSRQMFSGACRRNLPERTARAAATAKPANNRPSTGRRCLPKADPRRPQHR
jgi:hypothetical protein